MAYNMDKMDSNNCLPSVSYLVVATLLKLEAVAIFAVLLETMPNGVNGAILVAAVWAAFNQVTEVYYSAKKTLPQKIAVLFISLLVLLCIDLAAHMALVHFTYVWHGQTKIDTVKIWALAKLFVFTGLFFGILRLLASVADHLTNKYRNSKNRRNLTQPARVNLQQKLQQNDSEK